MPGPLVDILLATFNGERFLPQQIASLLAQTEQDFRILARDDGSRDGTPALLREAAAASPGRIEVVDTATPGRGACDNFATLATASTAPYIMFCDQDDIWHPHKVAESLAEMRRLEGELGAATPILVHADLRVVDGDLRVIAPSYARFQGLQDQDDHDFPGRLILNLIPGCAMMANRALVELALPVPAAALLHDHWFALVAAAFGRVAKIDKPLMDYRQHSGNAVGARGMGVRGMWQRARNMGGGGWNRRLLAYSGQAAAFHARFDKQLLGAKRHACEALAGLPQQGWWGRRTAICHHRLWFAGVVRNLVWLIMV